MSLFDKIVDSLEAYQQEMWRDRYPYLTLEPQGFRNKWVHKQNGNGCRPVKTQTSVLMNKNPAPLPGVQAKVAATPATSTPTVALTKEAQALAQTIAMHAATSKPAEKPKADDNPQPPPFDLLDLPAGMDAMGFKYAAYCARRWFNGKANVIPDRSSAIVDKAFVDTDTFKLSWILRFGNVKARYDHLLATGQKSDVPENIYNTNARNELLKTLQSFMGRHSQYYADTFNTLAECGNNKQLLHQQFQFQRVSVTGFDVLGGPLKLVENEVKGGAVMNDLAASLANFGFFAAIATAKVLTDQYNRYSNSEPRQQCVHSKVEITHIYVYARDIYSFNDKVTISQYLGHWNRHGVIIATDAATAEGVSKLSKHLAYESSNEQKCYLPPPPAHLDKPVDAGSKLKAREVFYPIRNRDFDHWRSLKGRGGDFVIFSDFERIQLPTPIVLDLGEKCWEYKK